jgi:thioredoxin reductase (NADPH)
MKEAKRHHNIAIIGAGAAGVMAALRGVLNNDKVIMFTGSAKDKKKSRAQWVRKVENIPGFQNLEKGILDPNKQTIEDIKNGAFAENLELAQESVKEVIKNDDGSFTILTDKGEHHADFTVLATGVMDVQPHIEGSIKGVFQYANLQLIDYCVRCDGHHVKDKETVIIGHTESAAWVSVMLVERYQVPGMTILTNGHEPEFSEELWELIDIYQIEVETAPIMEIMGDAKKGLMEGFMLEESKWVHAGIAFVSLGMIVYNDLAKGLGVELDQRGFVKTNVKGESNVENFYAVGDIQAGTKKQIYTSWDSAVDALDDINAKIRRINRQTKLNNHRARKLKQTRVV